MESSKTFVSGLLFLSITDQYYRVIKNAGVLTLLLRKSQEKPELKNGAIAILEYREKPKVPPKKDKLTIHGIGLTVTPN